MACAAVAAGSMIALPDQHSYHGMDMFTAGRAVIPRDTGTSHSMGDVSRISKSAPSPVSRRLQSSASEIRIFTHMLDGFGTQISGGYGIGARLEFR